MTDPSTDEQQSTSTPDAEASLRHGTRGAGVAVLHHAVTGVLVAAALALVVWIVLNPPFTDAVETPSATAAINDARVASSRTRIEWALEVHRIMSKDYPSTLETLVDRGLLRSSDLYYPVEGVEWVYSTANEEFELSTKGSK